MGRIEKKKDKKAALSGVLAFALCMALGFAAGWLAASFMGDVDFSLPGMAALLVGVWLGGMAQTVCHEAGHLAAGLATGYRFVSFRIGSVMLIRQNGRLRLCRYTLPGTGGQCLLAPPPWRAHGFPAALYNLGGVTANLLLSALCLAAMRLLYGSHPLAALCFAVTALLGLFLAILNGVPLRVGGMPNDGLNALCIGRDEATARALWAQLSINAAQAEGQRLRDMPADWFELPEGAQPDDPLKAAVPVARYERLLDEGRYGEAETLRRQLLDSAKCASAHVYALGLYGAFFAFLDGRPADAQAELADKGLQKFKKAMKTNPLTWLVDYAQARAGRDDAAADKARQGLEKALCGWPYAGDAAYLRELQALAETKLPL